MSFKTSELDVGCHLLTAEVFKRKMCELERYECGNIVITCALVVDQKGFGHLLPVALGLVRVAIKPKYIQADVILKYNFHD